MGIDIIPSSFLIALQKQKNHGLILFLYAFLRANK